MLSIVPNIFESRMFRILAKYMNNTGTPTTTITLIKNLKISNISNKTNLTVVHKLVNASDELRLIESVTLAPSTMMLYLL